MTAPTTTFNVRAVPVNDNPALERARVHDVFADGRRIGGICWARGGWRVMGHCRVAYSSRDDAVKALLERKR